VILGLLMSLLFPAVVHVRAAAWLTQCTNNLHEVGVLIQIYQNKGSRFGMFPPKESLGNHGYRMAPGKRDPAVPRSLPEKFGLHATFACMRLTENDSGVWVCPSAPDWMRQHGNTYAFSIAEIFKEKLDVKGAGNHEATSRPLPRCVRSRTLGRRSVNRRAGPRHFRKMRLSLRVCRSRYTCPLWTINNSRRPCNSSSDAITRTPATP
jgi:hypothetical protein